MRNGVVSGQSSSRVIVRTAMTRIPDQRSRRDFLLRSAALSATLALPAALWAQPRFPRNPFTLGVASGHPQPDGLALWTRLAPDPLNGGGMPPAVVNVRWEVAADERFRKIVARGEAAAVPAFAHSVHVGVRNLQPARWYWYRFMAGDVVSPVGRTRTAPAVYDAATPLSFAVASCQHYEHGFYAAYRDMAQRNPDLMIHVGDYIYEASWGRRTFVRHHDTPEPYTLDDYRNRYALYKSDPQLQAAHAACPWLVTWDDHEVDNDYANDRSQDLDPVDAFLRRRAAAYQAYYEHMPLPPGSYAGGPNMKIYGSHAMGALANIQLLDMRQYRDYHVCSRRGRGGGNQVNTAECTDLRLPGRSLLGATQERWLEQALTASAARWNVIAQTTLMAQADREPGPERVVYTDGWDGYPLAREKLLRFLGERRISNPVVVGGDVHFASASDLKVNFDDEKSPAVASEFVTTSISSFGPSRARVEALLAENPHVRFANGSRRGYLLCSVTPKRLETTFMAVVAPEDAQSRVYELAHYAVENGRAGPQRA